MFKPLLAISCCLACCVGNDYPAKAQFIDDSVFSSRIEEQRRNFDNQQLQMRFQQLEIDQLRNEMWLNRDHNKYSY